MSRAQLQFEDEAGERVRIPARAVVCSRCDGTGTHVNPAVDGHGIGAEEWAHEWEDEEREAYLAGRYDVTCERCHGNRVELLPDVARCTWAQKRVLVLERQRRRDDAELRAEVDAERRAGA